MTEVARRLNVSSVTVYRRIWEGSLPAFRIGDGSSALRVDAAELERWLHRSEKSRPVGAMTAASWAETFPAPNDPVARDYGTLSVAQSRPSAPAGQER